jgi:hypothetical protein
MLGLCTNQTDACSTRLQPGGWQALSRRVPHAPNLRVGVLTFPRFSLDAEQIQSEPLENPCL